jgi:DNA invertase Pin-like site-specific DNA recombinase
MSPEPKAAIRCAIYTRKSSEEGLEQSFNSLDAQREACEAFISSQRHEGWKALPNRYDDGGYSGGTMERPALRRLLQDIEAGKVNVIVVYKVDRLTRSLADFAKIVEALDAKAVSFVSVTQQFNTTSSMGRLTLNILLSFAQFEREVTGERIRDKIAASKKKGMWMGGFIPLGYNLDGRKLVPNPKEAQLVSKIFSLYLQVGCVRKLARQLNQEKIRSKAWTTRTGARMGGAPFARGALYALLRNRLYIGEVRHREKWYPGEHRRIVPQELWQKVQAQLEGNLKTRRKRARDGASSLLTGLVEDAQRNRFTPSFTTKRGRRYRYYVSQNVIQNPGQEHARATRFPAHEIESRVMQRLVGFLNSDAEVFEQLGVDGQTPAKLRAEVTGAKKLADKMRFLPADDLRDLLSLFLQRVVIGEDRMQVMISRKDLRRLLINGGNAIPSNFSEPRKPQDMNDSFCLSIESKLKRYGGVVHMVVPPNPTNTLTSKTKPSLLKALARANNWYEIVLRGKALDQRALARHAGMTERYVGKVFQCAFLAPDIVEAILQGNQPDDLTFAKLSRQIPLSWAEQRRQFGFPPIASR